MKNSMLFLTCLLACGTSFAQNLVKVQGKIVDDKNQVIAYAVVKLKRLADTNKVKVQQASVSGEFIFDQLVAGNYQLLLSNVGYQPKSINLLVAAESIDLKAIVLQGEAKLLKEVSIEAKKPFVERKIDKTVLNVENSIVASGGTVLEVLEKAPGVIIDKQNDVIKLNNKSGITIMIDGRTNFLSSTDATTLLSNMSSDQVATIELITNPSSKYDASGNAGIINIKLKKNKNLGTNGNLMVQGGEALMPNMPKQAYRAGVNLNLNHRVAKWNYFGNVAYVGKANANVITVNRVSNNEGISSVFDQNFERGNGGIGYQIKAGVDYFANDKTVFGVMIDANTISGDLDNASVTNIKESQNGASTNNRVLQQTNATSPADNLTANLNMKRDFGKDGKNVTIDLDYAGFGSKNKENFDASYFDNSGQNNKNTFLSNNTHRDIRVFALKSDITLPLTKNFKVETGVKSSYVSTKNNFLAEQLVNNIWQNDLTRSNNFKYQENINAAYVNANKEWEKWGLQLGLRAEQTNSSGVLITDRSKLNRSYLSLFPTAFLQQKFNKNNSLRYGYSRRVDRPNYQQLNPFLFYMDPYAVEQGNPYLKPQFTDNFEINYSYKEFGFSISYANTKDLINQFTTQDDVTGIIKVIRVNLGRTQNYNASLNAPIKIAKSWNIQNNISLYYNVINDPNLIGDIRFNKVAASFNTSQSFTITKTFTAELTFWLNTPRISGVEETTVTQYAFNIGLQKLMLDKKLKMRFAIDDIFLTNYWAGKMQYQNLNMTAVNRYTSRKAMLSLAYNFGNQNVKGARNRNTATDDIKNRTN